MSLQRIRTRIYAFPFDNELFDARLIAVSEEKAGRHSNDILLDVDVLHPLGEPEPAEVEGRRAELVRGEYVPHRLRFRKARWVRFGGLYTQLDTLPLEHDARRLYGILHWSTTAFGKSYLVCSHALVPADLIFQASSCTLEPRVDAEITPAEYLRWWAFTPPQPAGTVPERHALLRQFAGDPITIQLGGRRFRHRLFIGGIRHQTQQRPQVDYVLNLCEVRNAWALDTDAHPGDRHVCKGEMAVGMSLDELRAEAEWVAERLSAGKKVLVHCYAGVNRSSTVCCAALMLLEHLTAEAALARVREYHPGCWPDPYYWFLLRQLETSPVPLAPEAGEPAPLLREEVPVR